MTGPASWRCRGAGPSPNSLHLPDTAESETAPEEHAESETAPEGHAESETAPAEDAESDDAAGDRHARPHRSWRGPGPGHFGGFVEDLADDFAEDLAAELGLDTDEVADAIEAVRERWMADFSDTMAEHRDELAEHRDALAEQFTEQLDQAVAEDVLTQGQADALADLFADPSAIAPGRLDDLTDEQRGALEALREWAGEAFEPEAHEHRGGPGFGPVPDGEATVQESALQTT